MSTDSAKLWRWRESVKQARAYVRCCACSCTRGKGLTRSRHRLCNRCQADAILTDLRKQIHDAYKLTKRCFCPRCSCSLTSTDYEARRCTQCNTPIAT